MWKVAVLGFLLGLQAQTMGPEARTSLHYNAVHHALVWNSPEAPTAGDKIEIVDLIGRRVAVLQPLPAEEGMLSLPALPEGLYYARWTTESGRIRAVRRFTVTR